MNKNILVFGQGFFGKRVQSYLKCRISTQEIHLLADVEDELKKFKPKIIINCIGYTGERNVDDCERHKDKTLFANTFIPMFLAEAAIRGNIKLVHISSGCIFHYNYRTEKPITENKIPDFFDLFYSRSKIYSELALSDLSSQHNILILRPRIPLDVYPHPKNLLNKLLKFSKIVDIPNSVTYVPDFLRALKHFILIDARGIYNTVNKGGLRYPKLLDVYKKFVPEFKYQKIDYRELRMVRTNLLLSVSKLEKTGFKVRNINEALEECVKNYLKYS